MLYNRHISSGILLQHITLTAVLIKMNILSHYQQPAYHSQLYCSLHLLSFGIKAVSHIHQFDPKPKTGSVHTQIIQQHSLYLKKGN